MSMTNEELLTKVAVFKALGHPARLTMVVALTEGEQCVCELQRLVGSDTSTVSKHLAVLKQAGVVQDRKEGLWVYYRLRTPCVRQLLDCFTVLPNKEEGEIVAAGILSTPAVAIDGTISPAGASPKRRRCSGGSSTHLPGDGGRDCEST